MIVWCCFEFLTCGRPTPSELKNSPDYDVLASFYPLVQRAHYLSQGRLATGHNNGDQQLDDSQLRKQVSQVVVSLVTDSSQLVTVTLSGSMSESAVAPVDDIIIYSPLCEHPSPSCFKKTENWIVKVARSRARDFTDDSVWMCGPAAIFWARRSQRCAIPARPTGSSG